MNTTEIKKLFIPRDKPKSWIVFIYAGLIGLLVAGPIAIGGSIFEIRFFGIMGGFLFFLCWATMAAMFVVGMISRIFGHWKIVQEKDWKDQVW